MQPQTPHPLAARQTEVLLHLLRHDRPEYDVLRHQVAHATVTKYWWDPSASFDMEVVGGVPAAALPDGHHADAEWGWTPDGEPEGNLIVWVEAGRLAGLEYAVVADEYPNELPEVGHIREPLRRTEYVLHDDAWDDATRHAATRAALALIAPAASAASTDIPWDRRDSWPLEVVEAAQRLDALVVRESDGPRAYTQTGIMRLHDDQVRQDFVTFSPYAYDVTVWAEGEEVVSLADEGTSLVVALTDDQRDALTRVIGVGSLVTLQQWRDRHPSALRRLLQRVTGKGR